MSLYPNPSWVADKYECANCGGLTDRYRGIEDNPKWGGVVTCKHCGGKNTELVHQAEHVPPAVDGAEVLTA